MPDSRTTGSDASSGQGYGKLPELINLAFVALLGWWTINLQPAESPALMLRPADLQPCESDQYGYLRGEVFGAVRKTLDWRGRSMLCDGMLRPDNRGLRLVFSESAEAPDAGLRLVIGIAGAVPGGDDAELIANVTLIDQDQGLFFSTQGMERCWARLIEQVQTPDQTGIWRISGQLYCVGALAAVDGPKSITLGEIDFSGRLTLEPDETR